MWLKEIRPGAYAGDRWSSRFRRWPATCRAARASFPSVVMMTTMPAVVAGVPGDHRLTPPGPDGEHRRGDAGGGAAGRCQRGLQASAARRRWLPSAYGTPDRAEDGQDRRPRQPLCGGGETPARGRDRHRHSRGPSESIILCDETANGTLAALDLIVESEHGPDSSAFLVTNSRAVAEAARKAIPEHWKQMGEQRVSFSSTVLCGPRGGVVLTPDFDAAIQLRQRLRARASGDHGQRPLRVSRPHHQCRRDPAGRAYAGAPRQFRARSQCRAAHLRPGAHLFAALGIRLHEADLGSAM